MSTAYRIFREVEGVVFACKHCDFRVELSKFKTGVVGSARTLAAAEMNKHIADKHPQRPFMRDPEEVLKERLLSYKTLIAEIRALQIAIPLLRDDPIPETDPKPTKS